APAQQGAVSAPASGGPSFAGFPAYAATVVVPQVTVRSKPSDVSGVIARLSKRNENGAPTTFLLQRADRGPDGRAWYNVLLPIRPNGSTGWIRADDVDITGLRYAIVVHLLSFRLDLLDNNKKVETLAIGVGAKNPPPPWGRYYIKELIQPP